MSASCVFKLSSCANAMSIQTWLMSYHVKTALYLASIPGSCAWVEKNEPGTHCLCMLSFPRISGNLEISRKTCSVTLTSARHTDFFRIKMPATDYALCER